MKQFITETDQGEVRRIGKRVPIAYRLDVRYAPTKIGDKEFVLPESALLLNLFYKTWTKAEIRFERYGKYDASSTVTFEK